MKMCERRERTKFKRKENTIMEAVGLESENIETPGTESDGPGGPNTQQDGNFDGNY